jgi:hypothetical protein
LNTTICPPAVAGFGENDCAPFWLVMVIVTALLAVVEDDVEAVVVEGALGVEE